MDKDLIYQIALTLVPNVGAVHARILIERFGDAFSVFKARKSLLENTEGIGTIRANYIKAFHHFQRAEEEIGFLEKYKIQPLFITNPHYPQRFLNCYDPPTLFYYKGTADLNSSKMLAIVGTRMNTDYGRQLTEQLVKELATSGVVIISGLAFGIDAIAHKTALSYNIPTIGVVGHGLDTIYPGQHKNLATEMTRQGGILTEFMSKTKPDKHNFPIRNRIVAGISDATVVIETTAKGGSLITAEMANNYNRDVFAMPGRTTDLKSSGCNLLIKSNKAILLTDAKQLLETLGWEDKKKPSRTAQRELFLQFNEKEKVIVDLLKEKETLPIDELLFKSNLSSSTMAETMLGLEFKGVVMSLPGKIYRLA